MPSYELVHEAAASVLDNVSLLARRLRQRPVTAGLSQPEAATLTLLGRTAPTTVADLARAENVRPQSMGAIVSSLEASGLVKRQRDRADGRRVLLTVTKAGRGVAARKLTGRDEQLAEGLSSGFTNEELRQLVAVAPLLGRLAGQLGERPSGSVS